jgi:uncharacterized protein YcaQ
MLRLSLPAARALLIAAQGLERPPRHAGKADVLAAIRRMGVLQIDTIHVVARSPYLVLWSRLGNYDPVWLDELLAEGALFEYWAHEAAFVPIEDYPLFRHRMADAGSLGWKYSHEWMDEHRTVVDRVLAHVREHGPVRSADFERTDGKKGGWWGWKPEKRALEMLFTAGELMVSRREHFQRIYDLRERVLPGRYDGRRPSAKAANRALVAKATKSLGIATEAWIADYYRMRRSETAKALAELTADGILLPAQIAGIAAPCYVHTDNAELADAAAAGSLQPTRTVLLSPFDPIVWDRKRAEELFRFEYRIECYTPAPRRRYGYFTLPILRRGRLIGRLDPKAHRKDGIFEVKSIHLEPGVSLSASLTRDLARAIRECASWHGTPKVLLRGRSPKELMRPLREELGR